MIELLDDYENSGEPEFEEDEDPAFKEYLREQEEQQKQYE